MKKYLIGAAAGAILALAAGWLWKGHAVSELATENMVLEAKLEAATAEHQKWLEDAMKYIQGQDDQINELQGKTDSLMTVNADMEVQILALSQSAASASAEAEALRADVQPAIEANPKLKTYVLHLEKVIKDQSAEVELYMKYTANWKEAWSNSEKKYQAAVRISDTYKQALDREAALRKAVEERLSLQDKRISLLETRTRKLKWGTALAAGAGVLLGAILSD